MNYLFVMLKELDVSEVEPIINIGACYVAGSLRAHGYQIFSHCWETTADLEACITANNIDVICVGALSKEYLAVKNLISDLRKTEGKIKRKLIIILGGGLVTSESEIVLANIGADIGVIGQGEVTICEVADALKDKTSLKEVAGIIFKGEDGSLIKTSPRKEFDSLENVPYPAYDLFLQPDTKRLDIVASRSCPFKCTFCYHPSGEKYIQRSLESIFREIDHWAKKFPLKELVFVDELFAVKEERVLEFCARIKPYKISFALQMRVNNITQKILNALKESGCTLISLGLESADDRILQSMRKNITVQEIERALALIYQTGLPIRGSFIFGDVAEDLDTIETTCRWYKNHLHYSIGLVRLMVFPGTPLYQHAVAKKIIPDKLKFLEEGCPYLNLTKLSDEVWEAALEKVFQLEQLKTAKIIELKKLDEEGNCTFLYECFSCGRQNLAEKMHFTAQQPVDCKCGLRLWLKPNLFDLKNAPPEMRLENVNNIFKTPAAKNLRVAIYGTGIMAQMYLLASPNLRKYTVKIIEENPGDAMIWGYPIENPTLLINNQIDFIFAPDAEEKYHTMIANSLFSKYGIIAPVVSLRRLAWIAFNIKNKARYSAGSSGL